MERKGMRTTRKPERIGQLLTVAAAAAQSLARERLRPLGLTPRGWAVLSALAEEGPRPQIDLAAATGTDRTVMTYLLDELERQNLIERARSGFALDRKSTRLNSSHLVISYAVFCLKKKKNDRECGGGSRGYCGA